MSSRIKLINGCVTRLFGAFMTLDLMLRADFVQKVNSEEFIALQQEDETRRVPKFVIGLIYQAKDPSARMESTRFLIHDIGTIGYARLACGLDALVTVHHEHYEPLTPVRLTFGIPERDKQLLRMKKMAIPARQKEAAKELEKAWEEDKKHQPRAVYVAADCKKYGSRVELHIQGGGTRDWPEYTTVGKIKLENRETGHFFNLQYKVVLVRTPENYRADQIQLFAYLADKETDAAGQPRSVATFIEVTHDHARGYKPKSRVIHSANDAGVQDFEITDHFKNLMAYRHAVEVETVDYSATLERFGKLVSEANGGNVGTIAQLCKAEGFLVKERGFWGKLLRFL